MAVLRLDVRASCCETDPPLPADWRRLREARTVARRRVDLTKTTSERLRHAAFGGRLGAAVRSASPFLISLLDTEGLSLDRTVGLIAPAPGWPRRPRMCWEGLTGSKGSAHMLRQYVAGIAARPWHATSLDGRGHPHSFSLPNGGWATI